MPMHRACDLPKISISWPHHMYRAHHKQADGDAVGC